MAVPLTVAALRSFIGGESSFDLPLKGEKKDVGAHPLTILLPSLGRVVTTTEEASFRERASRSGLRKRAEVISTPFALRIAALRYTKRPVLSSGR